MYTYLYTYHILIIPQGIHICNISTSYVSMMFYGSILLWTWNGITSSTYVQNRSTLDPIDQLITGWPVSSCRVGPWSNVNFSMVLALLPSFHGLQLATWKKVFGWCLELDGLYLASYVWYIYVTHYIHIYIYLFIHIYEIYLFTYAYIHWTGVSLFRIAVGYDTSHCPIQKIQRGHWYWVMVQSWGITVYCNLLQLDCRYTFQSDDAATSRLHQQVSVDSRLAKVCDCAILLLEVSPSSPPKTRASTLILWFRTRVLSNLSTHTRIRKQIDNPTSNTPSSFTPVLPKRNRGTGYLFSYRWACYSPA